MRRGHGALLLAGVAAIAVVFAMTRKGASSAPPGRYVIPGDGTVYDTKTKLTWQQATLPVQTQSVAIAECPSVGLPGSGWRLPTIKELHTLMDFSAAALPLHRSDGLPGDPNRQPVGLLELQRSGREPRRVAGDGLDRVLLQPGDDVQPDERQRLRTLRPLADIGAVTDQLRLRGSREAAKPDHSFAPFVTSIPVRYFRLSSLAVARKTATVLVVPISSKIVLNVRRGLPRYPSHPLPPGQAAGNKLSSPPKMLP
jgi:hypothetical protein